MHSGLGGMAECISFAAEMATKSATAALRGQLKIALARLSKLIEQDCAGRYVGTDVAELTEHQDVVLASRWKYYS